MEEHATKRKRLHLAPLLVALAFLPAVHAGPVDEDTSGTLNDVTGLDEAQLPGTPILPDAEVPSPGPSTLATTTVFQDDFNDGVLDASKWSYTAGVMENGDCGAQSGTRALHFEGTGARTATTKALDVRNGGTAAFHLNAPTASTETGTCENPDGGTESILFQYKTSSGSWTTIASFTTTGGWTSQSFAIPSGAETSSTQFRWHQASSNGQDFDNWAIDDVQIDAVDPSPSIDSVSGSPHADSAKWYNSRSITLTWTATDPSGSGLAGYSYVLVDDPDSTTEPDCTIDTAHPIQSKTYTSVDIGTWGQYEFRVRAIDASGSATACGPREAFRFNVDAIQPDVPTRTGGVSSDPSQTIEVGYHDRDGGRDPTQMTGVLVSSVRFFVDGVDRTSDVNGGSGPGASGFTYTPSVAWSAGSHNLEVELKDTSVGATTRSVAWTFTYSPSSTVPGGGGGGGGVCGHENQAISADGQCQGGEYTHSGVDDSAEFAMEGGGSAFN